MGGPEKGLTRRKRPRTCVGCGAESPKRGLLRVVRGPDGKVAYDPTGKAPGRGAYICPDAECLRRAKKRNALARTLKVPVPESVYEELKPFCPEMTEDDP